MAVATTLAGCNKQTSSCSFESGEYGVCTVDTTGSADSVELPFYVDPEKSGSEFADHYDFEKAEGGVATFVAETHADGRDGAVRFAADSPGATVAGHRRGGRERLPHERAAAAAAARATERAADAGSRRSDASLDEPTELCGGPARPP